MKKAFTILVVSWMMVCGVSQVSVAATLNLKFYLEGFYIGSGIMQNELYKCGGTANNNLVDTVLVELHDPASAATVVASYTGVVIRDGSLSCTFSNALIGNSYYVAVK